MRILSKILVCMALLLGGSSSFIALAQTASAASNPAAAFAKSLQGRLASFDYSYSMSGSLPVNGSGSVKLQGNAFTMEGNVRINCHDTMDNIESKLNGFGFFRTHRKNIVNLKKVESFMNNYVALKNKCIVEMSPRRYKEFRVEYLKNGE